MATLSNPHDSRKAQTGERNPNWRGGRVVDPRGYVLLRMPDHPRADVRGYVYEHIIVAEQKYGRAILPTEEVHHRDEDKGNNDPSNLIVAECKSEHQQRYHRKRLDLQPFGDPNPIVECACGCGSTFAKYDTSRRPRRFISGHNGRGKDGRHAR